MRHPHPVEPLGQPLDRNLEHTPPQPPSLNPPVGKKQTQASNDHDCVNQGTPYLTHSAKRNAYTDSFSMTGATDTTWRRNFSSESVSPAATPTSCERCRIGIAKSRPVCFFNFDCQASSER